MRRLWLGISMALAAAGAAADGSAPYPVAPAHGGVCNFAPAPRAGVVRLVAAGDIVLGNAYAVDDIPASWDERYFAGVRPVFADADLVFGNLEGALTGYNMTRKVTGSDKVFAFRFPPRYGELLRRTGFTHLNIANNHALDFGDTGFADTQKNLQAAGIAAVGVPGRIDTFASKGLKIALLGYTYQSSFNNLLDLNASAELVRQAKAQGAFVIVSFHGGAEGTPAAQHRDDHEVFLGEQRGNVVAFSRAMIDAGADLVIGHGPHVLRSAECYRGKPIVYSLGNFVGVGGLSNRQLASASALLRVDISTKGKVAELALVPVRLDDSKLPQLDPAYFGARLVNRLGTKALFAGQFLSFSVPAAGDAEFEHWYQAMVRGTPAVPKKVEPAPLETGAADGK